MKSISETFKFILIRAEEDCSRNVLETEEGSYLEIRNYFSPHLWRESWRLERYFATFKGL